jgi:hypothetical protein
MKAMLHLKSCVPCYKDINYNAYSIYILDKRWLLPFAFKGF